MNLKCFFVLLRNDEGNLYLVCYRIYVQFEWIIAKLTGRMIIVVCFWINVCIKTKKKKIFFCWNVILYSKVFYLYNEIIIQHLIRIITFKLYIYSWYIYLRWKRFPCTKFSNQKIKIENRFNFYFLSNHRAT